MSIKDRKVFSISKFRGLDKENKLLKVASFRATNGKNFIIDSSTLKTRPAIKYKKDPIFVLESDDYIIDFHSFKNTFIYVTKKHIYIEDETLSSKFLNEKSSFARFTKNVFPVFNFSGLSPIFQEEKDSLFIFGLDYIFVIAIIDDLQFPDKRYVMYELRNKPTNPFSEYESAYKTFEDLPTAYEPTLFLGTNRLDDINLLSNVSKYRLFANTSEVNEDSEILYKLPTVYDASKHISFSKDISFYKNKFLNKAIPVFMGIENENFSGLSNYGTQYNSNVIEIQDVFYPVKDFEYYGDPNSYTAISEIVGLDKITFFRLKEKLTGQSVFEYLMQINSQELVANKYVKFNLKIQHRSIFRDETTNYVTSIIVEKSEVFVYVQLKKFENYAFKLTKEVFAGSTITYSNITLGAFPSYPTVITPTAQRTYNLSQNPLLTTTLSIENFKAMARTYIEQIQNTVNNGDKVLVQGQFYTKVLVPMVINDVERYQEFYVSAEKNDITWNNPATFNNFPTFSNNNNYPVLLPSVPFVDTSGTYIDLGSANVLSQIRQKILENYLDLSRSKNNGFIKLYVQTFYEEVPGTFKYKGVSIVVPFYYEREYDSYTKQSMAYGTEIEKVTEASEPLTLYKFNFNETEHAFELRVKDYFFDYNNEPSIDVKIIFEKNPDYDLIAKSRFGINFGSENRLFIAGHSDFPNIDRFNVSNDLLGDNIKNQSYESTYFPSKNFRVLGGRGAINGYVVATDSQLYVTKSDYANDQKVFIRERILNENGVVGYREYKTNINKTPLNNRCLVRFNNDIIMLTRDGLYALEISSNVQTNERLIKLRSGFVNKFMKNTISLVDHSKIFVIENNMYMYMFIGKDIFVADARYIDENKNGEVDNVSYEIVQWDAPVTFIHGKYIDGEMYLLDSTSQRFYHLIEEENTDDNVSRHIEKVSIQQLPSGFNAFLGTNEIDTIITNETNISFTFPNIFKKIADISRSDYHVDDGEVFVDNEIAFRNINDGDILYAFDSNAQLYGFEVTEFEFNNRTMFVPKYISGNPVGILYIYKNYSNVSLYLTNVFDYLIGDTIFKLFRLSPFKPEQVEYTEFEPDTDLEFILGNHDNNDFLSSDTFLNCKINRESNINVLWYSAILDLNNNLMEKTMFRMNIYATKQEKENSLKLGYKTMRRLKGIEETNALLIEKQISLSNPFSFEQFNFHNLSISTFDEMGTSIPLKENNFLYIQFVVSAEGQIELNSIEIIYKLNRMLKTIG
jgi:hypothetical protein